MCLSSVQYILDSCRLPPVFSVCCCPPFDVFQQFDALTNGKRRPTRSVPALRLADIADTGKPSGCMLLSRNKHWVSLQESRNEGLLRELYFTHLFIIGPATSWFALECTMIMLELRDNCRWIKPPWSTQEVLKRKDRLSCRWSVRPPVRFSGDPQFDHRRMGGRTMWSWLID